jgi:hypothetical protein
LPAPMRREQATRLLAGSLDPNAAGIGEPKQVGSPCDGSCPADKGQHSVLVPKILVEKDVLVEHHYRRFIELTTCSFEWDAALLGSVPVSVACVAPVAPDVYEYMR